MNLKLGQKSQKSAIYKCSYCANLRALIKGEVATPCTICYETNHKQYWIMTKRELLIATKNIREELKQQESTTDKISDAITDFCGNIYFVYVHLAWFAVWIFYNSWAAKPFDPYPYGMLTLVVSLEAIILATFILMSENRQGEISEMRAKLDYETDLKSEKHSAEILALLKKIYQETKQK